MISLEVEDKCQNCPRFSPELSVEDITTLEDKGKRLVQVIYCNNKDFCRDLEGYLRKGMTNE